MFEDILENQAILGKYRDQDGPNDLTRLKKIVQMNYFKVSEPSAVSDLTTKTRRS